MTERSKWLTILALGGGLLSGCGATQPALDRTALNVELSIHLKQDQLTVYMNQFNGSVLFSNPLELTAALQKPTTQYGMLVGPGAGWTGVRGCTAENAGKVVVNGYRAEEKSMTSAYRNATKLHGCKEIKWRDAGLRIVFRVTDHTVEALRVV